MLQSPIIADPDVEQAIVDFLPVAAEIRDCSARAEKLPVGSPQRSDAAQHIRSLRWDIETRAGRLGLTGGALTVLLNDALDDKARRGRGAPARPSVRTLMTTLSNAEAALVSAQAAEKAAAQEVRRCASAVAAAQEAYAAYAGGKLVEVEPA